MRKISLGVKRFIRHFPLSFILNPSSFLNGFTLIELLIVFSVLAIISTIGIASFQTYNDSQKLKSADLDIKTLLQQARSNSANQVKPSTCTGTLQGYEVRICCVPNGSNCPTCNSVNNYELDMDCSSIPNGVLVSSTKLSAGLNIDDTGTTQRSYFFLPITGGVVKGGSIVLDGVNNAKQSITVTNAGVIQ